MKSERVGSQVQFRRDLTGRQAFRAGLDQKAVGIKPVFLRECGQGRQDIRLFHISMDIETSPIQSRVISSITEIKRMS